MMVVTVALGITWRTAAHAASTPSFGAAASYGVLANTYTNSGAATTTVNGDVGFTVAPTIAPGGTHTNYGSGSPYTTAGADQDTALTTLNNQACTFTWNAAVDLFLDATHGTPGVYTPGIYCSVGAMNVTGSLTFNGSGTYIFRATGALGTTAGIGITLASGASACDVFWTPHATTLGAGTNFAGTLIDNDAVTVGANTAWTGRAFAFNGPVTTGASSTITVPACTLPPATLHVVKRVVNNSGGTASISSFSLYVKLAGVDVSGSPEPGTAAPGTSYSLAAGTYVVSEDVKAGYAATFSGDCNSSGSVTLASSEDKTCTITNDDIPVPPLIDVVKVPSPLTLPSGPGSVTYAYTVRNTGTVAMSNVTLTDNKCSPVGFISGDTNNDSKLDISETWTYQCVTTLSQTTTNTATVSGQANGFTATDTASATVVVSTSLPPPLIHVVKISSTLVVASGGSVTYTYTITNLGTAPLSNVSIVDDKCSLMSGPSGDNNNNNMLEASETWTYTCQTNLMVTTVSTAIAEGTANSLTATDSSIVTVVVIPPDVKVPDNAIPPPAIVTPVDFK
ncbi:MAG: hypothetical protein JWS12_358 [Candidatus Saccharibacteria bacterium]|nr:hypothetical protein [Candidatus Saccharibacteria bacterium]